MSGRPSKLTKETQERITEALRLGATYRLAAQYAGIHYSTFRNWMNAGEEAGHGRFFEFYDAVKRAEGAAAVGWLATIEEAARAGTWQAAAWKLERLHASAYALTQKQRLSSDPEHQLGPRRFTIKIDRASQGDDADTLTESQQHPSINGS